MAPTERKAPELPNEIVANILAIYLDDVLEKDREKLITPYETRRADHAKNLQLCLDSTGPITIDHDLSPLWDLALPPPHDDQVHVWVPRRPYPPLKGRPVTPLPRKTHGQYWAPELKELGFRPPVTSYASEMRKLAASSRGMAGMILRLAQVHLKITAERVHSLKSEFAQVRYLATKRHMKDPRPQANDGQG